MVHRPRKPLTLTLSQREGGTLNCAPSADAVAGNGGTLNCAPSADAVAGNGGTLNCAPSADAVAGNGGTLNCAPSADAVAGNGLGPAPTPSRQREQRLRLQPHALKLSLRYMGPGVDSPAKLAGPIAVRSTPTSLAGS